MITELKYISYPGTKMRRVFNSGDSNAIVKSMLVKIDSEVQLDDPEAGDRIEHTLRVLSSKELGGVKNYLATYFRTAINQVFV